MSDINTFPVNKASPFNPAIAPGPSTMASALPAGTLDDMKILHDMGYEQVTNPTPSQAIYTSCSCGCSRLCYLTQYNRSYTGASGTPTYPHYAPRVFSANESLSGFMSFAFCFTAVSVVCFHPS